MQELIKEDRASFAIAFGRSIVIGSPATLFFKHSSISE